jgi:hypothetical protein
LSYYVQVHGVLVEREVVRATNDIGRVLAQLDLNGITEEDNDEDRGRSRRLDTEERG